MQAPHISFYAILMLATASGCSDETNPDDRTDGAVAIAVDGASESIDAQTGNVETAAVIGQRCTPANRSGLILISGSGTNRYVQARLFDKASPLFGEPELTDSACDFHRFSQTAPCPICETGEICTMNGTCTPEPKPAQDAQLILRSEGSEQSLNLNPITGAGDEAISLTGDAISVELQGLGQTITLSALTIPDELTNVQGTLSGTYETPTGIDLSWTSPQDSTQVFTHIPINHHASAPTFTECSVESSTTSLHVDGAMLQPLAVITGLEFQGIEHIRFAAADTDIGCIEFRFHRQQFVNLGI